MKPLRHRRLWLGIGFGLVALVVYLSLTPQPLETGHVGAVDVGHFVAYFLLMLWFGQIYRGWRALFVIAALLAIMGIALEYAQGMTAHRSFDLADMRDNGIGIAVGLVLAATPLGLGLTRIEEWMGA